MIFVIKQLLTLIKALHSNNSENQIVWALLLGLGSALFPVYSLVGLICAVSALFFRVQLGMYFLSWLAFGLLSLMVLPLFHDIGYTILSLGAASEFYVFAQKNSVLSLTYFNNSIVMGALVVYFLSLVPLYIGFKFLLLKYRSAVQSFLESNKIVSFMKSSPLIKLFDLYKKYEI